MTNKNGGKKRIMETNRFENHPNEQIQGSIKEQSMSQG